MFSQKNREDQVNEALSKITLPTGVFIRAWREEDFKSIQALSSAEGWHTPEERPNEALLAWHHAWPAVVAMGEKNEVIGFIRALTDGEITTYVAEFLVAPQYRRQGIGRALLEICHYLVPRTRFDLLSTDAADQYYEGNGFERFQGFRKRW